ncbi:hypothetical protein SAMN05444149_107126 [Pseudosulfitobacter pseudonitzschiae]|nr:DUF6882 domain-containing protein [Pseudosulfitobacter pseudonitzschiae]QKS07421.1 hypothetical protein HT745_02465 [Pseudosulfitobacter pseudonitzschiae]SHF97558.1 hypothetical protein SAMN05444149_107126 [Pseudosulfitobacter pseudonitzschiae]
MIWPFRKAQNGRSAFSCEIECPDCGAPHSYEDEGFGALVQRSCIKQDACMVQLAAKFGIGNGVGNWQYDEEVGLLEFHFPDGKICETPLETIGSWFEPRNEFLWSWGNEYISEYQTAVAQKAQEFGEQRGFRPLTSKLVWLSLDDAWHLAKVAASVSKSKGVYAAPVSETLQMFFAITDPKWRPEH